GGLPRIGHRLRCWYLRETLTVGKGAWAYNEVRLATDPDAWTRYTRNNPPEDTLDATLAHCGFVGWMYANDTVADEPFRGVHGHGTVGWDEVRYNLKPSDLDNGLRPPPVFRSYRCGTRRISLTSTLSGRVSA